MGALKTFCLNSLKQHCLQL